MGCDYYVVKILCGYFRKSGTAQQEEFLHELSRSSQYYSSLCEDDDFHTYEELTARERARCERRTVLCENGKWNEELSLAKKQEYLQLVGLLPGSTIMTLTLQCYTERR